MQQKTFYKTLLEVNVNPDKAKQCLSDKRLTNTEKKILECYLLIRNNQNTEATELMRGLPESEFPFVEAQRKLLLGVALNNQSLFTEAESSIWLAIPTFKELESHDFLFLGYFNLCFIYVNTSQFPKMKEMILAMEKLPQGNELQQLRILRCKFDYFTETGNREMALELLKQIAPKKMFLPESDIISHLVSEFMFYVKEEDFSMCTKVLTEMKKFRKFHLSENYQYMKKLLDHLVKDTPIYAYHDEFQGVPILLHQIKVIQALEEHNQDLAKSHWNSLKSTCALTYKDDFKYEGVKCLFSLCLQKHLKTKIDTLQFSVRKDLPKMEALIMLLTEAKAPLAAGLIYELLWDKPIEEKEDLKKISRLVSRAKTEKKIIIEYRKGTYALKSSAAEKAS